MSKLTQLERRFVSCYQGVPAQNIASAEGITVDRVLSTWADLKQRGLVASVATAAAAQGQLSLDDLDHLMRANRAPAPTPAP